MPEKSPGSSAALTALSDRDLEGILSHVDRERHPARFQEVRDELARRRGQKVRTAPLGAAPGRAPTPLYDARMLVGIGAYLSLVGGLHLIEIVSLPAGTIPEPDLPRWLFAYLGLLCAVILSSGLTLIGAAWAARARKALARPVGLAGTAGICLFSVAHAWFLFAYERAFADGGLIWGVLHVLLLVRMPTTGTAAGVAGYRFGQGIGIAIWLALAWASFVAVRASGAARRAVAASAPAPPTESRPST